VIANIIDGCESLATGPTTLEISGHAVKQQTGVDAPE